MIETKYERAFCLELNRSISPFMAKELYINSKSEYYGIKLNFKCLCEICDAELYGVNIYTDGKFKKTPHFRKKPKSNHSKNCDYATKNQFGTKKKSRDKKLENYKKQNFPTKFVFEGLKTKIAGINIVDDITINNFGKAIKDFNRCDNNCSKRATITTSILDNVVDCYENASDERLNSEYLELGNKKISYKDSFKNIKYYFEEEGLIYYSSINELKKYGEGVSLQLEEKIFLDNKSFLVNIYIDKELIINSKKEKYYEKLFIKLMNLERKKVYFTGVCPKIKSVKSKLNDNLYDIVNFEIINLNHISFVY